MTRVATPATSQAALAKKEKEAAKKALRRERRAFWSMCKVQNYFMGTGTAEGGSVPAGRMQDLEGLCDSLGMEQLQALKSRLRDASCEEGKAVVEEAVSCRGGR